MPASLIWFSFWACTTSRVRLIFGDSACFLYSCWCSRSMGPPLSQKALRLIQPKEWATTYLGKCQHFADGAAVMPSLMLLKWQRHYEFLTFCFDMAMLALLRVEVIWFSRVDSYCILLISPANLSWSSFMRPIFIFILSACTWKLHAFIYYTLFNMALWPFTFYMGHIYIDTKTSANWLFWHFFDLY